MAFSLPIFFFSSFSIKKKNGNKQIQGFNKKEQNCEKAGKQMIRSERFGKLHAKAVKNVNKEYMTDTSPDDHIPYESKLVQ